MALVQELADLAGLGVEVTRTDLRPVLHLLDPDVDRLATALLGTLCLVELELSEVHDPAHGRVGHGGHLHQVQIEFLGDRQGLG